VPKCIIGSYIFFIINRCHAASFRFWQILSDCKCWCGCNGMRVMQLGKINGYSLQVELVERESSNAMFVARNSNCFRNVTLHFACFIQLSLSVTCFILDLCRPRYICMLLYV